MEICLQNLREKLHTDWKTWRWLNPQQLRYTNRLQQQRGITTARRLPPSTAASVQSSQCTGCSGEHTHSNLTSNRLSYCPATAQLSASICKTNICPLNQVKRWPCRVLDSLSAGRLITVPNSTILVEFSREMQTSLRSITLCGVMEGKQTKLKH